MLTVLFTADIPIDSSEFTVIVPVALLIASILSTLLLTSFEANIPTDCGLPLAIFISLLFCNVNFLGAPLTDSPYIPTFLITFVRFIIPSFKIE